MVLGLVPMFGGSTEKSLATFLIPLYNSVQSMQGIFSFTYEPVQVLLTIVINILTAGVLAWILTILFNNEKVMFSK